MRTARQSAGAPGRAVPGRGEVVVGLVDDGDAPLRQGVDESPDLRPGVPGAHRVVRVGDVHEGGPGLGDPFEHSLQVDAVAGVGHLFQAAAETAHVVVESGVGTARGDHGSPRLDEDANHQSEQVVDPGAYADLTRVDPVVGGEGCGEVEVLRVVVEAELPDRGEHRLAGPWRYAEGGLVCPDANIYGTAAEPLQRLGTYERHRRRQSAQDLRQRQRPDLPGHGGLGDSIGRGVGQAAYRGGERNLSPPAGKG